MRLISLVLAMAPAFACQLIEGDRILIEGAALLGAHAL